MDGTPTGAGHVTWAKTAPILAAAAPFIAEGLLAVGLLIVAIKVAGIRRLILEDRRTRRLSEKRILTQTIAIRTLLTEEREQRAARASTTTPLPIVGAASSPPGRTPRTSDRPR